ncbi:MAG: hypothetical protein QNK82_13145 [Akkermansiaceae bacterium]|jgi:hypothetical protein|tara:strand:+ start:809 stop:1174 length:366 start_codon:yes stop_codon:yes gene_type:complete
MSDDRDFGLQPLAKFIEDWGLSHHDLVEASPEQLTHKQVQRAAQGRKLTLKMKQKVARTLNFAVWGRLNDQEREGYFEYFPKHLFSYNKGWSEDFEDPNVALYNSLAGRTLRKDFREELGL